MAISTPRGIYTVPGIGYDPGVMDAKAHFAVEMLRQKGYKIKMAAPLEGDYTEFTTKDKVWRIANTYMATVDASVLIAQLEEWASGSEGSKHTVGKVDRSATDVWVDSWAEKAKK